MFWAALVILFVGGARANDCDNCAHCNCEADLLFGCADWNCWRCNYGYYRHDEYCLGCSYGSGYDVGNGYYRNGDRCNGYTTSNTQDRRSCRSSCSAGTAASAGQHLSAACSGTGSRDRTCTSCRVRPGFYRTGGTCTGRSTRDTQTWAPCRSSCSVGQYLSVPCDGLGTRDRTCANCSHGGATWDAGEGHHRSGTVCLGTGTEDTQSRTACRTSCPEPLELTSPCFGVGSRDTTQCMTFAPTTSPTTSDPTTSPTTSEPTVSPTRHPSNGPTTSDPSASPTISPTASPTRELHVHDTLRMNLLRADVSSQDLAALAEQHFFGTTGAEVLDMSNTMHPTDALTDDPVYTTFCSSRTGDASEAPVNASALLALLPPLGSDGSGATCSSTLSNWAAAFARPHGALFFKHCYDMTSRQHYSYIEGGALGSLLNTQNSPLGGLQLPRLTIVDEGCGDDLIVKYEFVARGSGVSPLLEAATGNRNNGGILDRAIAIGSAFIPGLQGLLQAIDNPRLLVHPARHAARAGGTVGGVAVDFTLAMPEMDDTCAARETNTQNCQCLRADCDPAVALTIASPSNVPGVDGIDLFSVIQNAASLGSGLGGGFSSQLSMFTGVTFGIILADGFHGYGGNALVTGLFGLEPPLRTYVADDVGVMPDGLTIVALVANGMLPDGTTAAYNDVTCNVLCQMAKNLLQDGQYLMMTGRIDPGTQNFQLAGIFRDTQGIPLGVLPVALTQVSLHITFSWGSRPAFSAMVRGRFEVPRTAYDASDRDVTVDGSNWIFRFSNGETQTLPAANFQGLADGPLEFEGGIGAELSTTSGLVFRFRFGLNGFYMNAFGAGHFHMGNTGIDLRLGGYVFPFVDALAGRADMCLGSYGRCVLCLSDRSCEYAIRARVFASVGCNAANNWFHGSLSGELSLHGILEALEYHDVLRYIPDALSVVALQPRSGQQDMIVSFAPRRIVQTGLVQADGTVSSFVIPQGFQFDGSVVLFPQVPALRWAAELHVIMSTHRFYINYTQDPIRWGCSSLGCILEFTAHDSPDRGPQCYVDARFPFTGRSGLTAVAEGIPGTQLLAPTGFSFEALMSARVSVLGMSAAVLVNITRDHAHFAVEGSLWGSFLRVGGNVTVIYSDASSVSFRARGYIQQGGVSQIAQRLYTSMNDEASEAEQQRDAAQAEEQRTRAGAAARRGEATSARDGRQQDYDTSVANIDANERELRNARNSEEAKSRERLSFQAAVDRICTFQDCDWYDVICHAENVACGVMHAVAWLIDGVGWLLDRVIEAIRWIIRRIQTFIENSRVLALIMSGKFNLLELAEAVVQDVVYIGTAAVNAVVEAVQRIGQLFLAGLEFLARMLGRLLGAIIQIHNLEVDMELSASIRAVTFRIDVTMFGFRINEQLTIDFSSIPRAIWSIIRTVVGFVKGLLGFRRRRQLEGAMAQTDKWDPLVERAARQIMAQPPADLDCRACLIGAIGFISDVHRALAEIHARDTQLQEAAANVTHAMETASIEGILLASKAKLMRNAIRLDSEPGSSTQWASLVGNVSLDSMLASRELQSLNGTYNNCSNALRQRSADISTTDWYVRLQAALTNSTLNGVGCPTDELQCSGISSCVRATSTYIQNTFAELSDDAAYDCDPFNGTEINCDSESADVRARADELVERWRTLGPRLRNMLPCHQRNAMSSDEPCSEEPSTLAEALEITTAVQAIVGSIRVREVCGNVSTAAFVNGSMEEQISAMARELLDEQQPELNVSELVRSSSPRPLPATIAPDPVLDFAPAANITAAIEAASTPPLSGAPGIEGPWSFFAPTDSRIGQLLRANITFDEDLGTVTIRVPRCLSTGAFLIRFVVGEDVEAAVFDAPRRSFTLDFADLLASEHIVEIAKPDVGTGWLQLSSNFSSSSAAGATTNVQVRAHRANDPAVKAQILLTIVVVDADADECTSDMSFATGQGEGGDSMTTMVAACVGSIFLLIVVALVFRHKRKVSGRAVFKPTDGSADCTGPIHSNTMFELGFGKAAAVGNPAGPQSSAVKAGPSESISETFLHSLSGGTVYAIPLAEAAPRAVPHSTPPKKGISRQSRKQSTYDGFGGSTNDAPSDRAPAIGDQPSQADGQPVNGRGVPTCDVAAFLSASGNSDGATYDQATSNPPYKVASARGTGMAGGMPTYIAASQSASSSMCTAASAGGVAMYDEAGSGPAYDAASQSASPPMYTAASGGVAMYDEASGAVPKWNCTLMNKATALATLTGRSAGTFIIRGAFPSRLALTVVTAKDEALYHQHVDRTSAGTFKLRKGSIEHASLEALVHYHHDPSQVGLPVHLV